MGKTGTNNTNATDEITAAVALATEEAEKEKARIAAELEKAKAEADKLRLEAEAEKQRLEAELLAAKEAAEAAQAELAKGGKAIPQPEPSEPGIVTVYCKLPSGLAFPLQMPENAGADFDGQVGSTLVLYGSNAGAGHSFCGFGVTRVKEDIWNQVLKHYKGHPAIANQVVFAGSQAEAKEKQGVKTGLEYLNPKKIGPGLSTYKKTQHG